MRVIVKARHMQLTPALKELAEHKLGDAVAHVLHRPGSHIEIELTHLGHWHNQTDKECKVTVFMPHGKTIVISERDNDMYKAIYLAHDRLINQVTRECERKNNLSRLRKLAERGRDFITRANSTVSPEKWELEVQEYEQSLVHI